MSDSRSDSGSNSDNAMMHIEDIKKLLPHRYPFLLVDRVNEIAGETISAQKNVTANEEFFNGHFPGAPMMPGVLQVEALAQAGGILLMSQQDNPQDYLMVFTGITNCKFRRQVVPGDVLVLEVEFTGRRRQFVQMKGKATVDGDVTCELEASAALVNKE